MIGALVPWQLKAILGALAALIIAASAFYAGYHWEALALEHYQRQVADQAAATAQATLAYERAAAAKTAQISLAAAQRQLAIQTITNEHIREVPIHVTAQADARCIVPVGAVRLHDAAAQGVPANAVPGPAGQPDDAPSGVALSRLSTAFAANYGTCNGVRQALTDLQAWVRAQEVSTK